MKMSSSTYVYNPRIGPWIKAKAYFYRGPLRMKADMELVLMNLGHLIGCRKSMAFYGDAYAQQYTSTG